MLALSPHHQIINTVNDSRGNLPCSLVARESDSLPSCREFKREQHSFSQQKEVTDQSGVEREKCRCRLILGTGREHNGKGHR